MAISAAISPRLILLGFLSWLVPLLASIPFFDRSGQLLIAQPLFKSLMVVIGGGCGTFLLVLAFRRIAATLANGVALGLSWLVLNLALDLVRNALHSLGEPPCSHEYADLHQSGGERRHGNDAEKKLAPAAHAFSRVLAC